MILCTFWVWHKEFDGPDCVTARNQSFIDDNPEGWKREKQRVLDLYGDDVASHREIEVRVDYNAVLRSWYPDPIEGEVSS